MFFLFYLATAASLQCVLRHTRMCVVDLVRDEVGMLDVVKGSDPGEGCQLVVVANITISVGLSTTRGRHNC